MSAFARCWRLAWPLILANLGVPLLGFVDTGVVGHLPDPAFLAGVALGATVVSVLYFLFGFLRMGTTGLTAQALGAGIEEELGATLVRGLLLALGLGLLVILAGPIVLAAATLLFAPDAATLASFATYLAIRLFGAPAALANFVLLGWLLGLQDSRGPLVLLIFANGLNAVLALTLVLGFGLGVPGVALATLASEYAGLGLGLFLVRRHLRRRGAPLPGARRIFHRQRVLRLLTVNRDIFLRSLMLETAFLSFVALGSRQGEVVLAANAVLMNFFTLAAFGLDGFAHAAEAMVGKAVGERDAAAFKASTQAAFSLAAVLALLLTSGFWLGGEAIIRLLTDLDVVRATAATYLPYAVLIPAVAVWAFVFDGIFFGATRVAELRNAMVVAMLVFFAGAFALTGPLGNHGLWLAMLIFLAARGLLLWLVYHRARGGLAFALG